MRASLIVLVEGELVRTALEALDRVLAAALRDSDSHPCEHPPVFLRSFAIRGC